MPLGYLITAMVAARLSRGEGILGQGLKELEERYREGIARVLGVPPSEIKESIIKKWAEHWAKAFTKPEYWSRLGISSMIYTYSAYILDDGGVHY